MSQDRAQIRSMVFSPSAQVLSVAARQDARQLDPGTMTLASVPED